MKKKLLAVSALVLASIALVLWFNQDKIGMRLAQNRIAALKLGEDPIAALPDGLHVGLCGAGSPFPDPLRSGPCTVVIAGKRMFVFDAGSGAARGIARMRLNNGQIDALFLTHFHSDHIDGVGELLLQRWGTAAHTDTLPVYGPPGLQQVVDGFRQAYTPDSGYRIKHHGEKIIPPSGFGATAHIFDMPTATAPRVVLAEPDLEITAFAADHDPVHPSVGYKIRYKDRSVVISGDTKKSENVARAAANADLLLHEALSPALLGLIEAGFADAKRDNLRQIMHDVLDYHTTPEQAAEVAQQAGVRALVLHHIVPPLPSRALHAAFLGDAKKRFDGALQIGQDGDWISLPAGSRSIDFSVRN